MEKEFVPYELAVKLKELGFNDKSLGFSYMKFNCDGINNGSIEIIVPNNLYNPYDSICIAPLWQQAFDWFREKYNLDGYVFSNSSNRYTLVVKELFTRNTLIETPFNYKDTYEEARQACLEKLIELCKKN